MDKQTLIVTEIERSAIHDGPGLRTMVFLQGCPLHCFWCCNPETQPLHPVLLHDEKKCVGCGGCMAVCPQKAISLRDGKAVVDRALCRGCGGCVAVCPVGANAMSGKVMTPKEILAAVNKDRDYYAATGGGLTLSGGEPLLQHAAVELLRLAKEAGLSTWVETTAFVPWATLEKALPFIDGFYVDYKHHDGEKLYEATGADITVIEDNLRRLAARGANLTLRTPVIPGFNEDRAVLEKCFAFSKTLGLRKHVLLPYHSLGRRKYEKLGKPYPMEDVPNMLPAALADAAAIGEAMGLAVQIGG